VGAQPQPGQRVHHARGPGDAGPVAQAPCPAPRARGARAGVGSHPRGERARRLVPSFAYTGRNARGELIKGRLEGNDSGAVADLLLTTGITPVEIKQAAGDAKGAAGAAHWSARLFAPPVTLVDLMLFSRQMYTLLKAGVPIMRALAGLEESMINPTFKSVVADLRASLDSGRELSASMRRHPRVFSNFYVSL